MLKKITNKIRDERIALGLSQKEFTNFVGIKYATYRLFEQTGKISLENYLLILKKINKLNEFDKFLDSFEFDNNKQRVGLNNKKKQNILLKPIISPSKKQIVLDKDIFGEELFYSVQNGHIYDVSNFIEIILSHYTDDRIRLLLQYFGVDRLKSYILKKNDFKLLKIFNSHVEYLQKVTHVR